MKKIAVIILALGLAGLNACKKDTDDTKTPEVKADPKMAITVEVVDDNGSPLVLNQKYVTSEGDSVSISMLSYWLSNVELVKEDNTTWKEKDSYRLMEESSVKSRNSFSLANVPAGKYKAIRFSIGVDADHNASIDSMKGELDVSKGMSWTWNTGYIFLSTGGSYYSKSKTDWANWQYHIGTDDNYKTVTLNFPQTITVEAGNEAEVQIGFKQTSIFTSPNKMDLDANSVLMTGPANLTLKVAENYASLFFVDHVHVK